MNELKEMTTEELEKLVKEARAELGNRNRNNLILYTHSCKDSAKYHLGKYKHWAKAVTSVDTTKTNGYAFAGEFLSVSREHKLPMGTIIVEVCGNNIRAYRLGSEGKECIEEGRTSAMSEFIEIVATFV